MQQREERLHNLVRVQAACEVALEGLHALGDLTHRRLQNEIEELLARVTLEAEALVGEIRAARRDR